MLLYSTMSASATRRAIDDRAVVANGAATVAGIDGSYLLDASAPSAPASGQPATSPRVPPTPSHTTVVWRIEAALPVEYGPRQLLVVDPTTFDDAESWDEQPLRLQVIAAPKVFPGVGVGLVAAAQPTLHAMGSLNPLFRPNFGPRSLASPFSTYLWSRDTPSALSSIL